MSDTTTTSPPIILGTESVSSTRLDLRNRHTHYFWKGRVALYAGLRALGVGPGDDVLVQGYTCVAVPNPVLYCGARPVYADIDPRTFNVSVDTLERAFTKDTKVVILQNTFGLPPDYKSLIHWARERGIRVISDCTHGLGSQYQGQDDGLFGDAAFFSFQWSKPITRGLGGALVVHDPELRVKVQQVAQEFARPSFSDSILLGAQVRLHQSLVTPRTQRGLTAAYRFLTQRLGLSVGSSSPAELNSAEPPAGFERLMSASQADRIKAELSTLEARVAARREIAKSYDDSAPDLGFEPPFRPKGSVHGFLRYSIRVQDAALARRRAASKNISIGEWFTSPIYPLASGFEKWGYVSGTCPVAELACRTVINLPTDHELTVDQIRTVIS